jgi:pyruvate dehydrogenase E1 component subunit alpha
MPAKTVYEAKIEHLQILDEQGQLDQALAQNTLSDEEVKQLYEQMIICREFDEQAFKLQRSGRMGTFPQNKGQEAAALGAAKALRRGVDHIVPFYRENPASFLHGLPMHYVLLFWMGDERGNAIPRHFCVSPHIIAIGTQTLHAAGLAWGFKMRKEQKVVMSFFGDGATSTGDFHEAMNFASVFKLPVVFCCLNNQFAISVPCCKQTGAETFAQKALAYGMPTIQVDGNDIFAVYKACKEAVERARAGGGPGFVECVTYRLGDHTTADDARRYRDVKQYDEAVKRDPMVRTRTFLEAKNLWNDELQKKTEQRAKAMVQDVVQAALRIEKPDVADMFDYTFEQLPPEIQKQKETMRTDSIGQEPEQIGLKPKDQEAHHA